MRNAIIAVTVVVVVLLGMLYWGLYPRHTDAYNGVPTQELHEILCVSENGEAGTYNITMPSFEGFTAVETKELQEQYAEDFCNHLRHI